MRRSLVYSHIWLYRLAMNLLYAGGYRERFHRITSLLGSGVESVCDLCFGDTVIADWCRARGIRWIGVDTNPHFCARARRRGFEVLEGDILSLDLPDADAFVMAGSLYHFHDTLQPLFDDVFGHSSRFVLSEPVRNLSSRGGKLGSIAQRSADPGTGGAPFRFDQQSLRAALEEQGRRLGLEIRVVSVGRDMLVDMRS